MSTKITNKQVKIISDANFNNNKIVNAKIDASENEITGVVEELQAGNGISISGNTISLKGTTQLPNETDIDTITTEGNYFINSPTSTYGLPDLPTIVPAGPVASWVCLLLIEKQYGYGTYFIRQTITFTPIAGSYITYLSSDTLMFTRILSDYTSQGYPATQTDWTKIDGDMTLITDYSYDRAKTLSNLKPGYSYLLNGTTTSLTLENIANSSDEIRVTFYTGDNFTLTQNQLTFLNFNNIQFEASKYYIITIKNLYATVDCVGENINYKTLIDQVIGKSDLQKKLVAGNNITITNYGWQGFSTTNNLELNGESKDQVNLIKFSLSELNKNSTFYHSQYYSDTISEVLNSYLEITNENKLHAHYEYIAYNGSSWIKVAYDSTGSTVLQANKYYWIKQVPQGYQPTINYVYLIEDNNYTINTLPDISQWTQQFTLGTALETFLLSQDYPSYIGYNPVNTDNYFSGVIQEFKTTNFNLSTAIEGTDFINNGCVNGAVISVTGGSSLPDQTGQAGKFLTTDGTTMSWAEAQGGDSLPNLYDIKTLSQAVIDKGWTYICNSTKQMLPKAKIPTVFNDIENKYINCDKELSEFQKVAVNKSDLKCNYFYNEKLEKYCYLSAARPYKIYSSVTPNLATQTLEYTNDDNKYGNCFAIGKNIIVVAIDSVDIDNIRYYRFDIFDRDLNYLRRIEVNGGSTRKNSQVNIYFRGDTFFYTINGQYGDNDPFQFMVTIKDDVNVNSGTFYKDVFGHGYPTQILQYDEHCPFTNVVDDRFVYMITQRSGSNTSGRKVYKFDLDNNTFTYCGDRHDGETISNLCYHNGKFYEFTRYNNSNNVYESSDCANWTLVSSFNTDKIGMIISLGNFCLCFGSNNIYSTTDFLTFTVYESNISTYNDFYQYYRNYIQTDDYFFAICYRSASGTTPYNFFGSTLIPKAYTDNYTINGTTVSIQYYKFEDWKICVSDGGTNDTNLDTVYNYLGYENYWLLDRNNEQLCLPRNSNLYTQMYVGDNYQDTLDGISGNATRLLPQAEVVNVTGATPEISVSANKNYSFDTAITELTITSVETSVLESVLYFTTGAGTISLSAPNTLRWGGGNEQPTLEPNTVYCISIRNGLAEIDTFGTVS